jgi:hypothetical protein
MRITLPANQLGAAPNFVGEATLKSHRHGTGWTGPHASSAIAFAWFVFDCDYHGPATVARISWRHQHVGT